MIKKVTFKKDAKVDLLAGAKLLSDVVGVTLGPKGHNVVYTDAFGQPIVTKDGVSVISHLEGGNPVQQIAVNIIRQAAQRTAKEAGDGTTSSTLLAAEMYRIGLESDLNPIQLKRDMDGCVKTLTKELHKMSMSCKNYKKIQQVAAVSANNDADIGKTIADAYKEVGFDGLLTVEGGHKIEDEVTIVKGLQVDCGMLSPYFITNLKTEEAELDNCFVLLVDGDINHFPDFAPLFEHAAKMGGSIVLMGTKIKQSTIATLARNVVGKAIQASAVELPNDTFTLENIAAFTGAQVVKLDLGDKPENLTPSFLGKCKKVKTGRKHTLFQEGQGDVTARLEELKGIDSEDAKRSIAALTGGIGIIKAGGSSEVEIQERVLRIEDALLASKAALDGGVVVGGGTAYVTLYNKFKGLCPPVMEALKVIQQTLQNNAGQELRLNEDELRTKGIFEPVKVVISSITNAASVAGMLLTTQCVISTEEDDSVHKVLLKDGK